MDKVAVFIDGGYLDKVLEHDFSFARIDYSKFVAGLCEGHELFRVYYYHCMPYQGSVPTEDEKRRYSAKRRFIDALSRFDRWEIRQGELKKRQEGFEQKGIDVMLSVDMVRLCWTGQINCVALIAGDSDFAYAVQSAKDAGVVVKMYYSRSSFSRDLWKTCDERHEITRDMIDRALRDY